MSQIGENVYPNTTFPDAIQTLPTFTDLSSIDQSNYINYLKAMVAGDITTANTYLNQITDTALINANKLNIIVDTIRAVEDTYQSSTTYEDVVDAKQAEWQDIINRFSYIGEWIEPTVWSSENIYTTNNVVLYNNKIWRCLTTGVTSATPPSEGQYWTQLYYKNSMVTYTDTHTNRNLLYIAVVEPSNASNPYVSSQWEQLTQLGDKGDDGIGFNFYPSWDSENIYSQGELIIYNNNTYSSLQNNNINHTPSTSTTWWKKEFELNMNKIPIQSNEPDGSTMEIGDLWFRII